VVQAGLASVGLLLAVPLYLLARTGAALILVRTLDGRWTQRTSNSEAMQLPLEIAMEVGSFLNYPDLTVSTTQLCSKGVEFVARPITDRSATVRIRLDELISNVSSSSAQQVIQCISAQGVAQEAGKRIEFCLARRANVAKIALDQQGIRTKNKRVYAELYRHLQHAVQVVQPNQNPAITVEWQVSATFTDVAGLVELVSATTDAPSGEAAEHRRYRLLLMLDLRGSYATDVTALASCQSSLHTLNLSESRVTDVSPLSSCHSLHRLDLSESRGVTDVSALASCLSLHTLKLHRTRVTDVSALASCQSLHTLDLAWLEVTDVSALASSESLHTLNLSGTHVTDVSPLSSCRSLHTLHLFSTDVTDVSALASSQSLHWVSLAGTKVTDVSALARCPTLRHLGLRETEVSNVTGLAASKSLRTLNLSRSKVRDVSALKSCISLREVDGDSGMAGYGALKQLLLQRKCGKPASQ
jgi:hypothetical protein